METNLRMSWICDQHDFGGIITTALV